MVGRGWRYEQDAGAPREARDAIVANTAGRRRRGVLVWFSLKEAAGMSREQGTTEAEV